jgi:hypothetical protein
MLQCDTTEYGASLPVARGVSSSDTYTIVVILPGVASGTGTQGTLLWMISVAAEDDAMMSCVRFHFARVWYKLSRSSPLSRLAF